MYVIYERYQSLKTEIYSWHFLTKYVLVIQQITLVFD